VRHDEYFTYGMLLLLGLALPLYLLRVFLRGRARHARTDADGGSVFLHKSAMELAYWMLDPLIDGLAALGLTPNQVTVFSLVPAMLAGVAAGFGLFGLACLLGTTSAFCDILDGLLARRLGTASESGEVVDAAVDRYGEVFLLGGMTIYYRTHWMMMLLTLGALCGSFMFSYTTAKTQAMGEKPARGTMRRAERAVYLLTGAGFTAITRVLFEGLPSHALRELPIIFALMLVAVVTNISSVQRFAALARALDGRRSPPLPTAHEAQGDAELIASQEPPARPL
jgi:phosphatidylglycerophosphate synthase